MANVKDEISIDVAWEDQQRICTFSRLHRRIQHLQTRLKLLTDDIEKFEDASTEVMICDSVKYVLGESFVDMDPDRASDLLQEEKTTLEKDKEGAEEELKELQSALGELKAQLYAKFGTQIYLEDQ
ncbi:unnamed protein product [Phytomonas sp. Hart1]|nr:unnamed protein product [Phytomonas sp. Hart1]|eukprot:CCW70896.1 unnamed protein product [Phytomonas sp. isolate Hart1]